MCECESVLSEYMCDYVWLRIAVCGTLVHYSVRLSCLCVGVHIDVCECLCTYVSVHVHVCWLAYVSECKGASACRSVHM